MSGRRYLPVSHPSTQRRRNRLSQLRARSRMAANRLPSGDVDPANDTAEQHSGGKNAYFLGGGGRDAGVRCCAC